MKWLLVGVVVSGGAIAARRAMTRRRGGTAAQRRWLALVATAVATIAWVVALIAISRAL